MATRAKAKAREKGSKLVTNQQRVFQRIHLKFAEEPPTPLRSHMLPRLCRDLESGHLTATLQPPRPSPRSKSRRSRLRPFKDCAKPQSQSDRTSAYRARTAPDIQDRHHHPIAGTAPLRLVPGMLVALKATKGLLNARVGLGADLLTGAETRGSVPEMRRHMMDQLPTAGRSMTERCGRFSIRFRDAKA